MKRRWRKARRAAGDHGQGKTRPEWEAASIPPCGALSGHRGFGLLEPKPAEHLGSVVGKKRPPGRGSAQLRAAPQCPGLLLSHSEIFPKKKQKPSSLEVLGSSTSTSGAEACELSLLLLVSEPGSWARWILEGAWCSCREETPDPGKRCSLAELAPSLSAPSLSCQVL